MTFSYPIWLRLAFKRPKIKSILCLLRTVRRMPVSRKTNSGLDQCLLLRCYYENMNYRASPREMIEERRVNTILRHLYHNKPSFSLLMKDNTVPISPPGPAQSTLSLAQSSGGSNIPFLVPVPLHLQDRKVLLEECHLWLYH
jgi:hypothetical protein